LKKLFIIIVVLFNIIISSYSQVTDQMSKPPDSIINRYHYQLIPAFQYSGWGEYLFIQDEYPEIIITYQKQVKSETKLFPFYKKSIIIRDKNINMYSTYIEEYDSNWTAYNSFIDSPIPFLLNSSSLFGEDNIGFIENQTKVGNLFLSIENYNNNFASDSITIITLHNENGDIVIKQEFYANLLFYKFDGTFLYLAGMGFGGSGHSVFIDIYNLYDLENGRGWVNTKTGELYKIQN